MVILNGKKLWLVSTYVVQYYNQFNAGSSIGFPFHSSHFDFLTPFLIRRLSISPFDMALPLLLQIIHARFFACKVMLVHVGNLTTFKNMVVKTFKNFIYLHINLLVFNLNVFISRQDVIWF